MATPSHPHPVLDLLDKMAQPLLVFNVAGSITFANAAAKQAPGNPAEALKEHPDIRNLVRDVALGKAKLPQPADLAVQGSDAPHFRGRFVPGPSGMDMALLLDAVAETPASHSGSLPLQQIIELLRSELLPPVTGLLHSLRGLPSGSHPAQAALEVSDRLGRLVDLVTVFGDDALVDDDRVLVPELMQSVCQQLAPVAQRLRAEFELVGEDAELPPIYGSRNLLQRAFRECLENAMLHARRDVAAAAPLRIEIRFTASGHYLLVGICNGGASASQRLSAQRQQPFAQSDVAPAAPASAAPKSLRIGLPLAKRIVELHGGHVRIGDNDGDEIQVLMELPTGAPMRGGARLDLAQAQKYAADLATLMSRQRKERK